MTSKERYLVRLTGCDDSTRFTAELTEAEAAAVRRIELLSAAASGFDCQPTLRVWHYDDAPDHERESLKGSDD
jgi:hypothetical protein